MFKRTDKLARSKMQRPSLTIIEIRPFRNGRQVYESAGVQPVFLNQEKAIDYAQGRAWFRAGEIRILDSNEAITRVIPFNETDRCFDRPESTSHGLLLRRTPAAPKQRLTTAFARQRLAHVVKVSPVIRVCDDSRNVIIPKTRRPVPKHGTRVWGPFTPIASQ